MAPDGSCPSCGARIATAATEEKVPKAPWHFKLLVVAVIVYLSWRLVQLVQWLI